MATITEKYGSHVMRWTEEVQGKAVRRSLALGKIGTLTKAELKNILNAKEIELSTGAKLLNLPKQTRVATFKDYVDDYLRWRSREYPDSHYRVEQIVYDHLIPVFGHLPLDLITMQDVEKYKLLRSRSVKNASIAKEIRTLKAVYNHALKMQILLHNPILGVAAPRILDQKPHRYYRKPELQALYASNELRAYVWRLYVNTGMRRMEGLNLKWQQVGHDGLHIISTGEERTKSGKWRDIPLSEGTKHALEHFKAITGTLLYVLPRLAPTSLSRQAIRDARQANLDGSIHTLRHTYISHLVLAGVPLRTVQLYAGHESYKTTEQYTYLIPDRASDVVTKLIL